MTITKTQNENETILKLAGHLNTLTAPSLEAEIGALEACSITLDLEELLYMSSAGLRVVLSTQKKMKAPYVLTLKNVNESVMEVLEITGLSDLLNII